MPPKKKPDPMVQSLIAIQEKIDEIQSNIDDSIIRFNNYLKYGLMIGGALTLLSFISLFI